MVAKAISKRLKELEREAKEKEYAHANFIDGVELLELSESIAIGRRKGAYVNCT